MLPLAPLMPMTIRRMLAPLHAGGRGAFTDLQACLVQSAEHRAFYAAITAWCRSRDETHAARMLRSPLSGVSIEIGGAYATLAQRRESLLELIAQEQLPFDMAEREALMNFAAML